jgi:hypothetical protein
MIQRVEVQALFGLSRNVYYITDNKDEAEAFAKYWGVDYQYDFFNYFKITI